MATAAPLVRPWTRRRDPAVAQRLAQIARLLIFASCFLLEACCPDCARLSRLGALSARGPVASGSIQGYPEGTAAPIGSIGDGQPGIAMPPDDSIVGGQAVGAGIYVNRDGDVLTTWDQIRACRRVAILDDYQLLAAAVVAGNPIRSLAILRTGRPVQAHATFQSVVPTAGATIHEFTYPIMDGVPLPLTQVPGVLRDTRSPDGIPGILQSSALIDGQSPGGPIVDQRGDVVAITVAKLEGHWPAGSSYGIGSVPISRFASAAGLEIRTQAAAWPTAFGETQNMAQKVGDYIVLVICFH